MLFLYKNMHWVSGSKKKDLFLGLHRVWRLGNRHTQAARGSMQALRGQGDERDVKQLRRARSTFERDQEGLYQPKKGLAEEGREEGGEGRGGLLILDPFAEATTSVAPETHGTLLSRDKLAGHSVRPAVRRNLGTAGKVSMTSLLSGVC